MQSKKYIYPKNIYILKNIYIYIYIFFLLGHSNLLARQNDIYLEYSPLF